MKTTFIYALIDPFTNEVRYVGKANDVKKRYSRHITDAMYRPKCHRLCWINGLLKNDAKPILKILEEVPIEIWGDRENYWISQFNNLTNMIDGGKFCPMMVPEIVEKVKLTKSLKPPYRMTNKQKEHLRIIAKNNWATGIWKRRNLSQEEKDRKGMEVMMAFKDNLRPIIKLDMNGNYITEYASVIIIPPISEYTRRNVLRCCRGYTRKAIGFIWKFKDDYAA